MAMSMYQASVPAFLQMLTSLSAILDKGCCARLAGRELPKYPDDEASFADLRARIARTLAFVQGFEPSDLDGSEERDIAITLAGQPMRFKGQHYLVNFVLPNFYFHATTAYAILRHAGLPIGKRDFMGAV